MLAGHSAVLLRVAEAEEEDLRMLRMLRLVARPRGQTVAAESRGFDSVVESGLNLILRLTVERLLFLQLAPRTEPGVGTAGRRRSRGGLGFTVPEILSHEKKGCFVFVKTQREVVLVQDALAGKLNKHWQ